MGMKNNGGQIVQVEGGHILRSTGRKDRHSKVYTAKGPRDRRVRLAAHTAIQFYDVQDRLGYDRPSKAVDWLINKAKNAIDKLEELPPWNPMETTSTVVNPNQNPNGLPLQQQQSEAYPFHDNPTHDDTMKSFFPTSSGMNYHNYPGDVISRSCSLQNNPQDLCLSLQSLQEDLNNNSPHPTPHQGLYSGQPEPNYQRMVGWDGEIKPAGYYFNAQPQMICQSSTTAFSQREPLQSSFSPYVRAWNDLPFPVSDHNNTLPIHQFSLSSGSQYGSDKFSGFQVPARIQGEEEQPSTTCTVVPSLITNLPLSSPCIRYGYYTTIIIQKKASSVLLAINYVKHFMFEIPLPSFDCILMCSFFVSCAVCNDISYLLI